MDTLAVQAALPVSSPAAVRYVPERSCVACRRRRPQGEFVRLTRTGGVWAVQSGHRTGRGSYLCADTPACWTEKKLKRMFGAQAAELSLRLLAAHSEMSIPPSFTVPPESAVSPDPYAMQ